MTLLHISVARGARSVGHARRHAIAVGPGHPRLYFTRVHPMRRATDVRWSGKPVCDYLNAEALIRARLPASPPPSTPRTVLVGRLWLARRIW